MIWFADFEMSTSASSKELWIADLKNIGWPTISLHYENNVEPTTGQSQLKLLDHPTLYEHRLSSTAE